jgi:hypothetical protein
MHSVSKLVPIGCASARRSASVLVLSGLQRAQAERDRVREERTVQAQAERERARAERVQRAVLTPEERIARKWERNRAWHAATTPEERDARKKLVREIRAGRAPEQVERERAQACVAHARRVAAAAAPDLDLDEMIAQGVLG